MASIFFDKVKVSESSKRYVDKSFAISDRIITLLKQKNMTQRQLAEAMGKRESEISKWLTGTHNFTLNTISRLEEVLCEDIMVIPKEWNFEISGGTHEIEDALADGNSTSENLNDYNHASNWTKEKATKGAGEEANYAIAA